MTGGKAAVNFRDHWTGLRFKTMLKHFKTGASRAYGIEAEAMISGNNFKSRYSIVLSLLLPRGHPL